MRKHDPDDLLDNPEDTLDLRNVLAMVSRRKASIALGFVLALVPVVSMILSLQNDYEATAKVAIQGTPEVMQLGPDYMPDEPLSRRSRSDPVLALIESDAVLGRVADKFSPELEPDPDPSTLSRLRIRLGMPDPVPVLTLHQIRHQRILGIRLSTTFELNGGGTVLEISSRDGSPGFAASLANTIAKEFVEYRLAEREAALRRASSWLGQRVFEVRAQIERGEEAIADLVERKGITPPDEREPEAESAAIVAQQLRTARIELLTTKQRLAQLEPRTLQQDLSKPGQETQLLEQQYADERAALERARLMYTPTHPELARSEAIVATLERRLESEGPSSMQSAAVAEALGEYRALEAEESHLEASVAVLERTLHELLVRHQPTSEAMMAYDRMQRELAINREMLGILLRRRNETMLAAATENPDARILDPAVTPVAPIAPNRPKWLALGLGMALSCGAGLGLLRELLDRRVRDPEEIADTLGLQILGVIPTIRDGSKPEHQGTISAHSDVAESYRLLRTTILFSHRSLGGAEKPVPAHGTRLGTLVVASGVPGEGKTTISINLAQSFASAGRSVLLIDADLRRPRVHSALELERAPGLAELLQDSLEPKTIVQRPREGDLDVVTSGDPSPNPAELLDPSRLALLFKELKAQYDLVLIDSPVLLGVPDALLLTALGDATLLVHKPESLDQSGLERIRTDLNRVNAKVLGIVLSQVKRSDRSVYPSYMESPYTQASSA